MRLVFLGTPVAAVPSLEALVGAGHDVIRVVTRPDRSVGRSRRLVAPPVKQAALAAGIPVVQPERVRGRAFREEIEALVPDVLVVVAFGKILSSRLLATPRLAPVNLHFSMLPAYRGAAPVQRALAAGERTSGVTTMWINERLDEGDILLQEETAIEPAERAPALERRLASIGADLLIRTLAQLEQGRARRRPQPAAGATYAPPLTRTDGDVDPACPAAEIEGRIRGFDPWPGVWLLRGGRRMRLVTGHVAPGGAVAGPDAAPGTLVPWESERLAMVCGERTLLVLEQVQPEGRRVMSLRDALNGRQLAAGEQLVAAGEHDGAGTR